MLSRISKRKSRYGGAERQKHPISPPLLRPYTLESSSDYESVDFRCAMSRGICGFLRNLAHSSRQNSIIRNLSVGPERHPIWCICIAFYCYPEALERN